MKHDARSILALDASPFGRSLDLVPSINVIRAARPTGHLIVAASAGICELLTSLRLADRTISLGTIKPSDKSVGSGLLRLIRLSRSIRGNEIDLVLDFSPGLATLLYSMTRRARIIAPVAARPRRRRAPASGRASGRQAGTDPYASILDQLGLNNPISSWAHRPPPEESSRFEDSMARSGFKGGEPILLLYTMEVGWSRSWPIRNYAELAALLSSNYGVRVVVSDVPLTNDFTSAIAPSLPDAIKLRSPRAVELIAAVARSSLVVTDDSGIARMARGLGTPAIDMGASVRAASPSSREARDIEAVYSQACLMLQTSRTGALFR